jgi:hypothetical protein
VSSPISGPRRSGIIGGSSRSKIAMVFGAFADSTLLDTSCVAYLAGEPVGFLFNPSDATGDAVLAPDAADRRGPGAEVCANYLAYRRVLR